MAAEIAKRGNKPSGHIVRPQAYSDQTYLDNIYEIFNQTCTPKQEDKETIIWVRFEHADVNDLSIHLEEGIRDVNIPPILLIIGYTTGVQIWCILPNGEAIEVLSLRQGQIKILKLLPAPITGKNVVDTFSMKRPLIAFADANSSAQYGTVSIISLKAGDEVASLSFKTTVNDIFCNKRVLVVTLEEKIHVFDAATFNEKFVVSSCFRFPSGNVNPVALGTQWLAYADKKLVSIHQTCGGVAGECTPSYFTQMYTAAKTITQKIGETVSQSLSSYKPPRVYSKKESKEEEGVPGVITILDVQADLSGEVNIDEDSEGEGIIAHFPAHVKSAISALAFDPSGVLLLTACKEARSFHVFRIFPHPAGSALGAVHHLYTLHRGDTSARVQDIAFSLDSRWVTISTLRGTTHVFPITPYGGQVCVRTHISVRMVNRLSRFQKSAGLQEDSPLHSHPGRNSPVHHHLGSGGGSPTGLRGSYDTHPSIHYQSGTFSGRMGNPRLPPYPHPVSISALAQIRLPHGMSTKSKEGTGSLTRSPSIPDYNMALAALFAPPRAWVLGSPNLARDKRDKRPVDSLFVISCHGNLIEYSLDPKPQNGLQKVADDSPIQLNYTALGQWSLLRSPNSPEVKPPLPSLNLLMIVQDLVNNERQATGSESQLPKDDAEDRWLSQVEIITHAGPHRRLWMGPQFTFMTFQQPNNTTVITSESSALLSQTPPESGPTYPSSDIYTEQLEINTIGNHPTRSEPIVVPRSNQSQQQCLFLIEATSGSFDQSSGVLEIRGSGWPDGGNFTPPSSSQEALDERLRANIADAMQDYKGEDSTRTRHRALAYGCQDTSCYQAPPLRQRDLIYFAQCDDDTPSASQPNTGS